MPDEGFCRDLNTKNQKIQLLTCKMETYIFLKSKIKKTVRDGTVKLDLILAPYQLGTI